MSTRKAPGIDGINAMILRKSWHHMGNLITGLFNDSLKCGYFPKVWRSAEVVTILKSKEKAREDPKSFRPVSLLPVLGKALEHLVCTRLNNEIKDKMAEGQHGFRKGKSTLTAINDVRNWVNSRPEKYVMGIFLDISGAFDNVKWEPLIQDMKELGASEATVRITESYLRNRTARIRLGNVTVNTTLTKGCPQGSGFGPSLWNITVNQVLAAEREEYTHRVAYADDMVALIAGDTRTQLIVRTERHIANLHQWADRYGLTFSMTKTMGMVMKGQLVSGFYLRFGDSRIKTVEKVKYLGVVLDQKMGYRSQALCVTEKSTTEFSRLRGIVGTDWGLSFGTSLILYRAIYVPRVTYAACIWMENWPESVRSKIVKGQRIPLLAVSRAYKTTSTDALQVITGLLPLDLQILWEGTKQECRQGNITEEAKRDLQNNILQMWQDRWDRSKKGELTRKIFPNIRRRIETPLFLNHYITQYLTGHGNFAAKLFSFKLKDSPDCVCQSGIDDVEHSIYDCQRWSRQRENLIRTITTEGESWPCELQILVKTKRIYKAFVKFARETLTAKQQTA